MKNKKAEEIFQKELNKLNKKLVSLDSDLAYWGENNPTDDGMNNFSIDYIKCSSKIEILEDLKKKLEKLI